MDASPRACCVLTLTVLGLVAATTTSAQEKTESPEANAELRVARLIHDLGADSFAVRNRADAELARLGLKHGGRSRKPPAATTRRCGLRAKDLLAQIKVYESLVGRQGDAAPRIPGPRRSSWRRWPSKPATTSWWATSSARSTTRT